MPRVHVTRRLHFNAAHRLHRAEWSEQKNAQVFGACANPNWHGHNYEIEVTVAGEPDPETGFVMDLSELKRLVTDRVVDDVDHRNINLEVPWMEGVNPTTENFVVAIWRRLVDGVPEGVELEKIVLHETPRNSVVYTGES